MSQPVSQTVTVFRGDSFDFVVRLFDEEGAPIDVAGSTFELQFGHLLKRTSDGTLVVTSTEDETIVRVRFWPEETKALPVGLASKFTFTRITSGRGRRTYVTGRINALDAPSGSTGDFGADLTVSDGETVIDLVVSDAGVSALAQVAEAISTATAAASSATASASAASADKTASQTARTQAQDARDASQAAQAASESARDDAEAARDELVDTIDEVADTRREVEKYLPYMSVAQVDDDAERVPFILDAQKQMHGYFDLRSKKLVFNLDFGAMRTFDPMQSVREIDVTGKTKIPIGVMLASGGMPIWWDTEDGSVHIPRLVSDGASGGGGSGGGSVALPAELDHGELLSTVSYLAVVTGQSLGEGSNGNPPLSTTQPYSNLTWEVGPKTRRTDNGFGNTSNTAAMTTPIPLVEVGVETTISSTCNGLVERAYRFDNVDPVDFQMFGVTAGRGGTSILLLRKAAAPDGSNTENYYRIYQDQLAKHVAWCAAQDPVRTPYLPFITIMHGEADKAMTADEYEAEAEAWYDEMQADAMAATGQTVPPHIILSQPGKGITNNATGGPAVAMHRLALKRQDVHLAGGIWHLPTPDNTHMINLGYRRRGVEYSVMAHDILVRRVFPKKCHMLSALWDGQRIVATFEVENAPLKIDENTVSAVTAYGLRIKDDTDTIAIESVKVAPDGVTLLITPASAPSAGAVLRCALDYRASGVTITEGATCNLRDSTEETFIANGTEYVRRNWAAHSEVLIRHIAY